MSELPEISNNELRRAEIAIDYINTIDDIELVRQAFVATFSLFVQDISEDYESGCLKAIQTVIDARK